MVKPGKNAPIGNSTAPKKSDAAPTIPPELIEQHLTEPAKNALTSLSKRLETVSWEKPALSQAIKDTMAEHGLKMPQVAIPLRVALLGVTQTPSIDAVLEVMGRGTVLERIAKATRNDTAG